MSEQEKPRFKEFKGFTASLAQTYLDGSVRNGEQANKNLQTLSSLLIAIAFSSIGLLLSSYVTLDNVLRWAICLMAFSILLGALQLLSDYKYFSDSQKLSGEIGLHLLSVQFLPEDSLQEKKDKISNLFDTQDKLGPHSQMICMILQVTLVTIGSLMILSTLLFS